MRNEETELSPFVGNRTISRKPKIIYKLLEIIRKSIKAFVFKVNIQK